MKQQRNASEVMDDLARIVYEHIEEWWLSKEGQSFVRAGIGYSEANIKRFMNRLHGHPGGLSRTVLQRLEAQGKLRVALEGTEFSVLPPKGGG